jgi:hypothetical protein
VVATNASNPDGRTNQYTPEFQEEVVRAWRTSVKSLRDVARELGGATEGGEGISAELGATSRAESRCARATVRPDHAGEVA